MLQTDDPSLRRLFPPAYTDDDDANDEFQRLMREELLEGKLAALEIVEQTAGAEHLTGEQLEGWLGALESLRLFLGTQLDVTRGDCTPSSSTPTTRAHRRSPCTAT